MAIKFDYSVPVNVARVMDLAAQFGVLSALNEDSSMRQELETRVDEQADLMTRQELRALRRAAELVLEVVK